MLDFTMSDVAFGYFEYHTKLKNQPETPSSHSLIFREVQSTLFRFFPTIIHEKYFTTLG